MLFSSVPFLFAFLPLVVAAYYAIARYAGAKAARLLLLAASLFFYGWWNPVYLTLIIGSIAFNYAAGRRLSATRNKTELILFVGANLLLLAYYKYAGFLVLNLNAMGAGLTVPQILLPLGISFITFQKIAYLVDCYKGRVPQGQKNWLDFSLFVTFFPQLIAGPIIHHSEIMPQFAKPKRFSLDGFTVGLCLLMIGLFKKLMIADHLDTYATPLFTAAAGRELHILEAWAAMLAYTFQIYFDFSGYSDMALGLGKMFGIRLPVNFFSPYRAKNIIEFWRRWHMTLSRFLRDYLYIPLGGNRKGPARRYVNLALTMLLGGLWHGAQWTFVVWGALHGIYLVINHFCHNKWPAMPPVLSRALTFLAVCVAWVFFRADSVVTATSILASLTHLQDFASYDPMSGRGPLSALFGAAPANRLPALLLGLLLACWFLPNSVEIMRRGKPAISGMQGFFPLPRSRTRDRLAWQPNFIWGLALGTALALSVVKVLYEPSQVFLYFQF